MEEDKIVKINSGNDKDKNKKEFIENIKVTPIKPDKSNVINIDLRKKMEERMWQLMKEYIFLGDEVVIEFFVSEFENEYEEGLPIEEYAKKLLEKLRREIGNR